MQSAREGLDRLANRILKDAGPDQAVVLAWPLVCGSAVAARTQALRFADGTLWVQVPDPGWRNQLQDFAVQYVHKLTQLSGTQVDRLAYEIVAAEQASRVL